MRMVLRCTGVLCGSGELYFCLINNSARVFGDIG